MFFFSPLMFALQIIDRQMAKNDANMVYFLFIYMFDMMMVYTEAFL